jgi:hypothetical protein
VNIQTAFYSPKVTLLSGVLVGFVEMKVLRQT